MPFGPTFDIRVRPMSLLPEYTVSVLTVQAKHTVYPVSTVRTKGSGLRASYPMSEPGLFHYRQKVAQIGRPYPANSIQPPNYAL
jgi:hypothetical protein